FSSRRRHTRSKRDWSSDVCSSDLRVSLVEEEEEARHRPERRYGEGVAERAQREGGGERQEETPDHGDQLEGDVQRDVVRERHDRSEERRVGKECRAGGAP